MPFCQILAGWDCREICQGLSTPRKSEKEEEGVARRRSAKVYLRPSV